MKKPVAECWKCKMFVNGIDYTSSYTYSKEIHIILPFLWGWVLKIWHPCRAKFWILGHIFTPGSGKLEVGLLLLFFGIVTAEVKFADEGLVVPVTKSAEPLDGSALSAFFISFEVSSSLLTLSRNSSLDFWPNGE